MIRICTTIGLTLLIALSAPTICRAQQPAADTIAELKAQIDALSRRIAELESLQDQVAPDSAPSGSPPPLASGSTDAPGDNAPEGAAPPAHEPPSRSAVVSTAPLGRALQGPGSAFQVDATEGSGSVSIKIAGSWGDPGLEGRNSGRGQYKVWSLTASAPLGDEDLHSLGTLDGLAKSSSLSLAWRRFNMTLSRAEDTNRDEEIEATARANCVRSAGGDDDLASACQGAMNDAFISEHAPNLHDEYLALFFPNEPSIAYGLEGTISYKKYDYIDTSSFAAASSEKAPWGIKGFASFMPRESLTAYTTALEYQRVYEEQDAAILCPTNTGPDATECLNGAVGTPNQDDKLLVSFEARRLFSNLLLGSDIGLSGQVTYDLANGETGFDAPIYLVPNSDGSLLGGIRFQYNSDKDDFVAGVFVGSAFSLF